jgi:hypothetical protein
MDDELDKEKFRSVDRVSGETEKKWDDVVHSTGNRAKACECPCVELFCTRFEVGAGQGANLSLGRSETVVPCIRGYPDGVLQPFVGPRTRDPHIPATHSVRSARPPLCCRT